MASLRHSGGKLSISLYSLKRESETQVTRMPAQSKSVQKHDYSPDLWLHITLHFSSASCFSYSTWGTATFIRQSSFPPTLTKPLPMKNRRLLSHTTQHNLKPSPPCKRSVSFLPLPGWFPASPHPHSLPKAGSSERAESGVSSKTASYLWKAWVGKDRRLRTGCLGQKVHDKTCFFAAESAYWSPTTVLPSTLILPKGMLFHPCRTP